MLVRFPSLIPGTGKAKRYRKDNGLLKDGYLCVPKT
jgi:hypothetical protein